MKAGTRSKRPHAARHHHPDAAGIDVGGSNHYVAVPADRDLHPVRNFSAFTEDLFALADWLTACRITTVAMEATGVYWIPLFEILERRGTCPLPGPLNAGWDCSLDQPHRAGCRFCVVFNVPRSGCMRHRYGLPFPTSRTRCSPRGNI